MPAFQSDLTPNKMPITSPELSTKPTWSQALAAPAQEFPPTPLPIVFGAIPAGLSGALYRNGLLGLLAGSIATCKLRDIRLKVRSIAGCMVTMG
jgi:carotenoid cleavage dioxygenase-like enzyme